MHLYIEDSLTLPFHLRHASLYWGQSYFNLSPQACIFILRRTVLDYPLTSGMRLYIEDSLTLISHLRHASLYWGGQSYLNLSSQACIFARDVLSYRGNMKPSKHEDDNIFNDPGIKYQKETITENITLLDYFLALIDKSLKHTKSIILTCIYMTADFPVLC
jgi:hypothetical protein